MGRKWPRLVLPAVTVALAAALVSPLAAGAAASGAEVAYLGAGEIAWTGVASVGDDGGSAELSTFSPSYENVKSADGSNVVAPGTKGELPVKVTNASTKVVSYAATASIELSDPALPVVAGDAPTTLSGTLKPGDSVEINLPWSWQFSSDADADVIDTAFGDAAAAGNAAVVSVSASVTFEESDDAVTEDPGPSASTEGASPDPGTPAEVGKSESDTPAEAGKPESNESAVPKTGDVGASGMAALTVFGGTFVFASMVLYLRFCMGRRSR